MEIEEIESVLKETKALFNKAKTKVSKDKKEVMKLLYQIVKKIDQLHETLVGEEEIACFEESGLAEIGTLLLFSGVRKSVEWRNWTLFEQIAEEKIDEKKGIEEAYNVFQMVTESFQEGEEEEKIIAAIGFILLFNLEELQEKAKEEKEIDNIKEVNKKVIQFLKENLQAVKKYEEWLFEEDKSYLYQILK